ncbi:uncharacterized protein [Eleutherodactylus coqui]|uniref:uncharacterized protein n=1 Tax=Eleutherodactylus coqui TaxID=57060 RepID=UPI003462D081
MQNIKEEPVDAEADENIVDGDETQAITLRSKRMGCPYDHHVPSKKVISEHITSAPVELSSGMQADEEEVWEAQHLIDQHGVYLRDHSDHRRYNPQQQTRFQGNIIFNRSRKHGRTSSGKFRKVCKDIICLPAEYPEDNCTYRVPRGKEREQFAMLGLVGKILIQSSWNFENFRAEVITLFRKYFSCSEEEFSFNFLQCLPGNRKLIKPNVSATFKWSGIAIISLAAQGSVYIKTPHALAARTKNLFFTTKQCLPRTESENVNENIPSDRTIPEIIRSGDTRLLNNVYQMDEEDSQHYPIKDLKVLQQQELGSDPSAETSSDTGNTDTKYDTEEKTFNMTNNMVFKMLRDAGIKTAHVKKVSEKLFVTCGCEIIPIVWGCWRIATGIYLKRHPATEGRKLYPPRVEFFYEQSRSYNFHATVEPPPR